MTTIAEKYYNNKKSLAKQASKIVSQVYNYADKLIQNKEVQQTLINKGEYRFLMTDIIPTKWESYNVAERVFLYQQIERIIHQQSTPMFPMFNFLSPFYKTKMSKEGVHLICIDSAHWDDTKNILFYLEVDKK